MRADVTDQEMLQVKARCEADIAKAMREFQVRTGVTIQNVIIHRTLRIPTTVAVACPVQGNTTSSPRVYSEATLPQIDGITLKVASPHPNWQPGPGRVIVPR